ncbi:HinT-interacting membrane complex protein P80 [Mycoplasma leonicaptivi]|uniref:HinT-interacting membrane complex protein P80 n=1 Tax=Mycoplasma leonicaptivi TaxID=36742 RepID=UPI0006874006|nr:hypothetical protein [Mycoplasma leonicaptivi]
MAKRKQSFFERLSNENDNFESKNKILKGKKKRNWINIGVLGGLSLAIILGISIPLGISVNKVDYVKPVEGDKTVFSFEKSLNNFLVNQLEKSVNDKQKSVNDKIDDLYRKAIFYLYDQEVKGSKNYQLLYNGSLEQGESPKKDLELKSIEEIRKNNQSKLDDLKSSYQRTYGFQSWENVYKEKLLSEEYGKSTTEQEALDFLVFGDIENIAKRRFEVEITTVDTSDLTRTAKINIANNDQLLANSGDRVFPFYEEGKNYFINPNNKNKATVIRTKSFIKEYINADKLIKQYFNNNNLYQLSNIVLPGIQKENLEFAFDFSKENAKDKFINMLKYSVRKSDDNQISFNKNIDIFKSFKDIENYGLNTKQNENEKQFLETKVTYEAYLDVLTMTKGSTLGNIGLNTFANLVKSNNDITIGSILNSQFQNEENKLPQIDLDKLFALPVGIDTENEEKIKKLEEEAKQILNSQDEEKIKLNKLAIKIEELNLVIEKMIKNLSDEQFNNLIKTNYNSQFNTTIGEKVWSSFIFNVKDMKDKKIVLNDKGINLVSVKSFKNNFELFEKALKDDLLNISRGNQTFYNIASKMNNSNVDKIDLLNELLSEEGFSTYLTEQKNKFNEDKNFTTSEISEIKEYVLSIKMGQNLKNEIETQKNIQDFVNKKFALGNIYNFVSHNGKIKIGYISGEDNQKQINYFDGGDAFEILEKEVRNNMKTNGGK